MKGHNILDSLFESVILEGSYEFVQSPSNLLFVDSVKTGPHQPGICGPSLANPTQRQFLVLSFYGVDAIFAQKICTAITDTVCDHKREIKEMELPQYPKHDLQLMSSAYS